MDYWTECVECALDEAGLPATPEQIQIIAGVVEGGYENYGMAMGHDVASTNWHAENERTKKALQDQIRREQNMVTCRPCNGFGYTMLFYGTRQSEIQCHKCNGKGRHDP